MYAASPLRGLAQVNIPAGDVAAARDWYARATGIEPYFQQPDAEAPAYVEFRLGDDQHELGIIDRRYLPASEAIGPAASSPAGTSMTSRLRSPGSASSAPPSTIPSPRAVTGS